MDVADCTLREVEVDDEVHSDEVDAATEQLRADHHPDVAIAKLLHRLVPLQT